MSVTGRRRQADNIVFHQHAVGCVGLPRACAATLGLHPEEMSCVLSY